MIGRVDVPGLAPDRNRVLNECLEQLADKQFINTRRTRYFDSKQVTQHLNISVPPQLNKVETVIGLPAKAVEKLEQRINLDGFVVPNGTMSDFGLDRLWSANKLGIEATEAHTSAGIYGVSFLAVMDQGLAQPVIRNLSPVNTTALWDADRRRAKAAVTVVEAESDSPKTLILYLDDAVLTLRQHAGRWSFEEKPHSLGRCPIAILPLKPSTEEPFGRSRITQAVMSVTDRLVRTYLRMETNAEFYASPQRALLDGDPDMFTDEQGNPLPGWSFLLSKLLVLPSVERDDGTFASPRVEQFQQATMQPHLEMLRQDYAAFAGETNIPVGSLGIIHDNPSSDAAMQTAYLDLNAEAERAHDTFGAGWVDAMQMAVMVRDGLTEVPEELELLRAKFRDPATVTKAAAAQWAVQLVQSGILPAESEVVLEQVGLDQTAIERVLADRRRITAGSTLAQMLQQNAAAPAEAPGGTAAVDEAAGLKAAFDALGVAIRAGVSPESAAARLGLTGIEFTGAVPTSLRQPVDEADELEEK